MGHCPGPFRGAVAIPIGLDCDMLHVLLGAVCGAITALHVLGPATFLAYQLVEEVPMGAIVHGLLWDMAHFFVGYGAVRMLLLADAKRNGTDG